MGEEVTNGDLKAGKQVSTVQGISGAKHGRGVEAGENDHLAGDRVDQPDEPDAGRERLKALAGHLGRGVPGAQDLDSQVGREVGDQRLGNATAGDAVPGDVGDVGDADETGDEPQSAERATARSDSR